MEYSIGELVSTEFRYTVRYILRTYLRHDATNREIGTLEVPTWQGLCFQELQWPSSKYTPGGYKYLP